MEKKDIVGQNEASVSSSVPWNPIVGVFLVLVIYFVSQLVGLSVLIYPLIKHWTNTAANAWLNNSIVAQFFFILIVEAVIVLSVLKIIKLYKAKPSIIGLRKPLLTDPLWGIAAVPLYYVLYFIGVGVASAFYHGLNVNQKQQIGFNSPHGAFQLFLTFLSLVILPPIAEEILVRGFLYSSLKKGTSKLFGLTRSSKFIAAVLTSLIFASAHLPEGGAAGPLWIAAIDTFILSMVLVLLREKTNGLWAGMTLHGIKNFVAFSIVFLAPLISFHI